MIWNLGIFDYPPEKVKELEKQRGGECFDKMAVLPEKGCDALKNAGDLLRFV